jgi:hypothetical protein
MQFDGEELWQERILLARVGLSRNHFVMVTPEDDVYLGDLSVKSKDVTKTRKQCRWMRASSRGVQSAEHLKDIPEEEAAKGIPKERRVVDNARFELVLDLTAVSWLALDDGPYGPRGAIMIPPDATDIPPAYDVHRARRVDEDDEDSLIKLFVAAQVGDEWWMSTCRLTDVDYGVCSDDKIKRAVEFWVTYDQVSFTPVVGIDQMVHQAQVIEDYHRERGRTEEDPVNSDIQDHSMNNTEEATVYDDMVGFSGASGSSGPGVVYPDEPGARLP